MMNNCFLRICSMNEDKDTNNFNSLTQIKLLFNKRLTFIEVHNNLDSFYDLIAILFHD